MSKRIAILVAIVAIAAVFISRYGFNRAPAPAVGVSATSAQGEAAKAASRVTSAADGSRMARSTFARVSSDGGPWARIRP